MTNEEVMEYSFRCLLKLIQSRLEPPPDGTLVEPSNETYLALDQLKSRERVRDWSMDRTVVRIVTNLLDDLCLCTELKTILVYGNALISFIDAIGIVSLRYVEVDNSEYLTFFIMHSLFPFHR